MNGKIDTAKYWPPNNPCSYYSTSMCNGTQLLNFLFSKYKINNFCEIGCYVGGGIKHILSLKNDLFICAIDTWDNQLLIDILNEMPDKPFKFIEDIQKYSLYDSFITNLWEYRNQILPLKMNSIDGLRRLHDLQINPDVVYIDSSHEYENTKRELNTVNDLFNNSIICGDDYDKNYGGVCPAVDEFVAENNYTLKLFDNNSTFLIEKALHIESGSMCGRELTDYYKNYCYQRFIKFKNENPSVFKNENINKNDIFTKLVNNEKFSFCRFSDGEYLLMKPKYSFLSRDNVLIPDKKTKLGEKLKEIIKHKEKNFKIGIVMSHVEGLPEMFKDIYDMTFSLKDSNDEHLWPTTVAGAATLAIKDFITRTKKDLILVANENACIDKCPLNIKEFFPIPTDGIQYYENNSKQFINDIRHLTQKHNDSIFLIGAGMLANVICYEGWNNKTNWYLDLGVGVHQLINQDLTAVIKNK